MKCVNENCRKDPMRSLKKVLWGCGGDFACNQYCYDEARKQMDYFCDTILPDDGKFADWLGVPVEQIKGTK